MAHATLVRVRQGLRDRHSDLEHRFPTARIAAVGSAADHVLQRLARHVFEDEVRRIVSEVAAEEPADPGVVGFGRNG
jgi:hypothetical protein